MLEGLHTSPLNTNGSSLYYNFLLVLQSLKDTQNPVSSRVFL